MNPRKAIAFVILCGSVTGASAQTIDFGKSYINVTKGTSGGTLEPGDTLEIRASIVVKGTGAFDSCSFRDAVPAGTVYIPGTVRILTNEGKIYQQFTDAPGDDAGWITSGNVSINLGYNTATYPATATRRGRITNTDRPSFYGNTCIMIAAFRVRVTAATGSRIATGGGRVTYRNRTRTSNPVLTSTFPANTVAVYTNFGMCSNSVGANSLGTEFNGSFGSGAAQNRGTSGNVPVGYTYATFTANAPQDYYYGVANNTSNGANFTTLNTWPKPDNATPTRRVFGVWDIIGDHTGATDPYVGNVPGDNAKTAGYMLVINAAYRIDSAFQQTISGLCPNTYYEISCWVRNICSKCGCDANGVGASSGNTAYIPTAPGDSSGVYPNLTFEVDGTDYYTTGNLLYTGKWVKRGFTFLTGPNQTSFTLKFFNNAPGGGGNDWALDDISVATCSPDLTFTPTANPKVCANNTVNIGCIIQSYFNNYIYYKWQKSTNGGLNWTETGVGGTGTPTHNGSEWEYNVQYPAFVATMADNGAKYKVVIGTTASNLENTNCAFSESTSTVTLDVMECGPVLGTDILSFTGKAESGKNRLQWTTSREEGAVQYTVERSLDGRRFTAIATVAGNRNGDELNTYTFTDGGVSEKNIQYRIRLTNAARETFSRIVRFGVEASAALQITNPFFNQLRLTYTAQKAEVLQLVLVNMSGQIVYRQRVMVIDGANQLTVSNTAALPNGLYTVQLNGTTIAATRRVLKQKQL